MKIAQFSSFGKPDEVIDCIDVNDLGDPNDNEVLIDVLACPINPADVLNIEGRYGVKAKTPDGNEVAEPVTGEEELKMVREGFGLSRKPKEPGTSMIVPFPQDVITDEILIKNAIERYRYGIFHGHFELEIGNTLINKDTILDVIKKNSNLV